MFNRICPAVLALSLLGWGAFADPLKDIGNALDGVWHQPPARYQGFHINTFTGNDGSEYLLVTFLGFTPSGERTWLSAQGPVAGATSELVLYSAQSYFNVDAGFIEQVGTLRLTLVDCDRAEVQFNITKYSAVRLPHAHLNLVRLLPVKEGSICK